MRKEPPRILVVEDEPDVCSYIQSYLGRRGYLISTTSSGSEALSIIEIIKPEVVILDFLLNDLDGREVLKRLREHDKKTKVIVVTGQQFPRQEVKKIYSLGISEYLVKPLLLDKLEHIIQQVIGGGFTSQIVFPKKVAKRETKASASSIVHKLSNLLGIIRNKCENFTSNIEDGIYKDKPNKELVDMSVEIMSDIMDTVDRASEVVDTIKRKK